MPNLLDSLNPITGIVSAVSGVLEKFIPSPEDRAKAQVELLTAQNAITLQLAQIDAQNNQTASAVLVAEAKSESWLTRNWRPLTMVMFDAILFYNFIVAPVFSLKSLPFDVHMWQLLTMGLGGYQFCRSGEKMWSDHVSAKVEIAKAGAPAGGAP